MSSHYGQPTPAEAAATLERMIFGAENAIYEEVGRFHSAEKRRSLAKEGKALSDGSYPIEDESDLGPALKLIQSGHGDVAAAKTLFKKRAKALGRANMIPDDWAAAQGSLSSDDRSVLQQALKLAAEADDALDELQPLLAKVLGVPSPDDDDVSSIRAIVERRSES